LAYADQQNKLPICSARFNEARLKASLQEALARDWQVERKLLSYDEIAQKLKLRSRSDRGVPRRSRSKAIVGSVGRYTDFTRNFFTT